MPSKPEMTSEQNEVPANAIEGTLWFEVRKENAQVDLSGVHKDLLNQIESQKAEIEQLKIKPGIAEAPAHDAEYNVAILQTRYAISNFMTATPS